MSEQKPSEEEEKPLFLLKRIYQYDQVGDLLKVIQPRRWVFVGSLLALLGAVLVWAFVGRIPTEVIGKMIAVYPESLLFITAKNEGIIDTIEVFEGQEVLKGTLLGTTYNPASQSIIYKIRMDRKKLQNLTEEITLLEDNLKTRERLYREGLIARTVVDNTHIDILGKRNTKNDIYNEITNLFSELEKISQYWDINIPKDPDNPESYAKLNLIEQQLSSIYAPGNIKILETLVKPKEHIEKNQQLFWIEQIKEEKQPLQFYTAIPIAQGNQLRVGMTAYIEPDNIINQEYGKLIGRVASVFPFAASEKELLSTIKNPEIIKYLTEEGKPITVVSIEGELDPSTVSGYAWTSKSGPPFKITPGTVGVVRIVTQEQSPISYLIPLWRIKFQ